MFRDRFSKKHLSGSDIERYERREMGPDELISASDHLAACSKCSPHTHNPNLVEAAYRAARNSLGIASDHLLFEQLAGYVDDHLSAPEREAVERHLAACEACESDLQGIFDLSAQIIARDRAPLISTVPSAGASPVFRERQRAPFYRGVLSALSYRPLLQAACLLAISALVIWAITRSTQKRIDGLTVQIRQLQAQNDSMREAASNADAQIARLQRENEDVQAAGDLTRMALRLDDGIGQVALDESGRIQGLEALPVELRTAVQTALTSARLQIASGPEVKIGRVGTLLGEAETETFKLITPVSSIVLSNVPAFKWESLAGATGYTVLVRDVNTGREIESALLSDTQWTPKEPLARGHTYAWMVEAVKDGRRLRSPALDKPYAGFKVLEKQSFEEIQRAQGSWGNSHLVMGILYAKAGLKDAARRELKELQAANPEVRIIDKLIKNLDSKR